VCYVLGLNLVILSGVFVKVEGMFGEMGLKSHPGHQRDFDDAIATQFLLNIL
jgi:hypothetical protein